MPLYRFYPRMSLIWARLPPNRRGPDGLSLRGFQPADLQVWDLHPEQTCQVPAPVGAQLGLVPETKL